MIFEMRRYECYPKKMKSLHALMKGLALPVFEKNGMEVVGAWTPVVGDQEEVLIYLLRFKSMDERNAKWKAFHSDPEWIEKRAVIAKQEGGPIVQRQVNAFWEAPEYSPLR